MHRIELIEQSSQGRDFPATRSPESREIRTERRDGCEPSSSSVFARDFECLGFERVSERDECRLDSRDADPSDRLHHESVPVVAVVHDDVQRPRPHGTRGDDLRSLGVYRLQTEDLARGSAGRAGLGTRPDQRRAQSLFARAGDRGHPVGIGKVSHDDAVSDHRRQLLATHTRGFCGAPAKDAERRGAEVRDYRNRRLLLH
jgi:hypothetical protein